MALREQFSSNEDITGLLNQVQENLIAAQRHQDIPFEQLVEKLNCFTRFKSSSYLSSDVWGRKFWRDYK